jgi:ABC-2 type transport system ATP-binding protein
MHPVLRLDQVVKTYGTHRAVDEVSFAVPPATLFGLLGPNGAGKTSLIRIITAITRADSGNVYLNGDRLAGRHPQSIGYMPEERGLYKRMKVFDHLMYLARLKGLSKSFADEQINHWMDKFDIQDWGTKKVEELSKGMQQKIQFIATVMHQPKLLILDEPFSGLDPINTNLIKDEIHQLKESGTSIIFSTHRMEQVEAICEHIVLINQGRNILEGKLQDIKDTFKDNLFEVIYKGSLPPGLGDQFRITERSDHRVVIQLEEGKHSGALLQYMVNNQVQVTSFQEILPTLNDIFIKQVEASNTTLPEEMNL